MTDFAVTCRPRRRCQHLTSLVAQIGCMST